MPKKLTQEEFIRRAKEVHGDKYDYSKVEYANTNTKVCVVCPIHGEFFINPSNHLHQKQGCKRCALEKTKMPIYGVGINDLLYAEKNLYSVWFYMVERCYNPKRHITMPTYICCEVCDEWKQLSNFKMWFDEHYVAGWELDKDILVKGNKVYSPETCCFVPLEINVLLTKTDRKRGDLPIGVHRQKKSYISQLSKGKTNAYLGSFATPKEAFDAYKTAKEAYIKEVADRWKDQLEPRVYEALYNYKVEITD